MIKFIEQDGEQFVNVQDILDWLENCYEQNLYRELLEASTNAKSQIVEHEVGDQEYELYLNGIDIGAADYKEGTVVCMKKYENVVREEYPELDIIVF